MDLSICITDPLCCMAEAITTSTSIKWINFFFKACSERLAAAAASDPLWHHHGHTSTGCSKPRTHHSKGNSAGHVCWTWDSDTGQPCPVDSHQLGWEFSQNCDCPKSFLPNPPLSFFFPPGFYFYLFIYFTIKYNIAVNFFSH